MPATDSPRVLVCPDSFKGTFEAREVASLITQGIRSVGGIEVDELPLGDGGEGTAFALTGSNPVRAAVTVSGPLGEPVAAQIFALGSDLWLVEASSACGLGLLPGGLRPLEASTAGVGELILEAAKRGANHVLVAAGGTSTTDGGAGAVRVLRGSTDLPKITVLCDTATPFELAADVFGPQKGATLSDVEVLRARLRDIASSSKRNPTGVLYGGAAGGLSGGLWAEFDAQLAPGAPFVLMQTDFVGKARGAACVVTGEGRADSQSLTGKLVGTVSETALRLGVPVALVVGQNRLGPLHRRRLGVRSVREASEARELVAAGAAIARELLSTSRYRPEFPTTPLEER